ncbi:MAG: NAD(P)/FAD-dependent oxidoreductase [Actinomycetota bacterium]|nr:NAD(P)/FAD-dependent oxidoreductase [Actinomycetota bacterium]
MGRFAAVAVVGAGAAGLSAAAELRRRGVPALVLERAAIGSSWRARYDSLILNTPRVTSTLGGYRMPRRYGRWPSRDAMVEYLEEYARRGELDVRCGVSVERLDRGDGGWSVTTSEGVLRAPQAVVATGHDIHPVLPPWPGRDEFPGTLVHSAGYRNADPFRGLDVLVVSASNSGSEIACELARDGAGRVWTARRSSPPIFPREWPRGFPVNPGACLLDLFPDRVADGVARVAQRVMYGDLSRCGLPRPDVGAQTRAKHLRQGALVDAGFVKAVKAGRIQVVAALERFEGPEAILADGMRVRPDAVIAATGYARDLESLVGHLGVLDPNGHPTVTGGRAHPAAPGLYFNGFHGTISGQLRYMRKHGRAIARAIARERRAAGSGRNVARGCE